MKKALVITYYWPPAGGPGVQRWLKFVTWLEEFGITPVLYVPENAKYPMQDPGLQQDVPTHLKVYRNKISEPLQWVSGMLKKDVKRISRGIVADTNPSLTEKILLWIRGNFFIPDARVNWVKPSVKFLKPLLKEEGIDMVVTTGPPHSVHLIGLGLKEQTGVRWVADFRDPWTSIGYHKKLRLGIRAQKKHKFLERKVLQAADKILTTSKTTQKEFEGLTNQPVKVVTNGYEHTLYQGKAKRDARFTLSHIGSLLSGRNPEVLWQTLGELTRDDEAFGKAFSLRLVGVVSPEVLASIRRHQLDEFLELKEYVPHTEVVGLQQASQLLLLIEIDSPETRGILPGKLFEYLAAKRPILAIGPEQWEAGEIVRESRAGEVFDYQPGAELKQKLREWFKAYQQNALEVNSAGIEKYSRREVTRQLAKELSWE